jgi:hypothetical protein
MVLVDCVMHWLPSPVALRSANPILPKSALLLLLFFLPDDWVEGFSERADSRATASRSPLPAAAGPRSRLRWGVASPGRATCIRRRGHRKPEKPGSRGIADDRVGRLPVIGVGDGHLEKCKMTAPAKIPYYLGFAASTPFDVAATKPQG